jgi:hypothetical protein
VFNVEHIVLEVMQNWRGVSVCKESRAVLNWLKADA